MNTTKTLEEIGYRLKKNNGKFICYEKEINWTTSTSI
jgi:hypothetical protein